MIEDAGIVESSCGAQIYSMKDVFVANVFALLKPKTLKFAVVAMSQRFYEAPHRSIQTAPRTISHLENSNPRTLIEYQSSLRLIKNFETYADRVRQETPTAAFVSLLHCEGIHVLVSFLLGLRSSEESYELSFSSQQ